MKLDNFLEIASTEAMQSPMLFGHGAILFTGRTILATGHNDWDSKVPLHAEQQVTLKARKDR